VAFSSAPTGKRKGEETPSLISQVKKRGPWGGEGKGRKGGNATIIFRRGLCKSISGGRKKREEVFPHSIKEGHISREGREGKRPTLPDPSISI